jgi:hypothetical protein
MSAFDAPDRETCVVRRARTNTPLQALILMNDPTYLEASRKLAERIFTEAGPDMTKRLEFAFRLVTGRKPSERETDVLRGVLAKQHEIFRTDPDSARKVLAIGESPRSDSPNLDELAAWSMLANTLLNLDEVVCKN